LHCSVNDEDCGSGSIDNATTIFVGCDSEGSFGGFACVATIRFHSHVDIFFHMSFVLSVLNVS